MAQKKIDFCYSVVGVGNAQGYKAPLLQILERARVNIAAATAQYPRRQALLDLLAPIQSGQLSKAVVGNRPLSNYIESIFTHLNQAQLSLPPEIPSSELPKWFPQDRTLRIKTITVTFEYQSSRFDKAMGWVGRGVLWGAVASVTMMGTVALLAGAKLIFLSMLAITAAVVHAERATAVSRWERLGSYLQRVTSRLYYDPKKVMKQKGLARGFWSAALTPYLYVFSLQRSLFLTAAAIRAFSAACGLALVGPLGTAVTFVLAGLSVLHMASLSVESVCKVWGLNKTEPTELPSFIHQQRMMGIQGVAGPAPASGYNSLAPGI